MPATYPMELRERVGRAVASGETIRSVAARFGVSIAFAQRMGRLKRETGSVEAKRQGGHLVSGLLVYRDVIVEKIEASPSVTLQALSAWLKEEHEKEAPVSTLDYFLRNIIKYSYKKKRYAQQNSGVRMSQRPAKPGRFCSEGLIPHGLYSSTRPAPPPTCRPVMAVRRAANAVSITPPPGTGKP